MVRNIHQSILHVGGSRAIHTELSKFYWIPKVTTLLRRVAYKCFTCRKKFARPTKQVMAPLPFFRLPSSKLHPFEYTAVDVAGPFSVTEMRVVQKRWLLILCCATLGAVQLEMIESMNTLSFLMAMERFLAVRPRPSVLLADNGTNFHGGETALEGKDQISMSQAQRKWSIKFEFAPPKAPHFQGLVERIVGVAKAAIKPALRTRVVTGEELRTIFAKAMGIVNNFPISYTVQSGQWTFITDH
jgi:hypothetical protein